MQFFGGRPPFGIVFDCAMGERIDTVLAMSVLYGLDGKNECRLISVSVSKPNLKSAALAELIGRFHAGAVSAGFAAVGRQLPVDKRDDTADPVAVIRNALTSQHEDSCAVVLAGPAANLTSTLGLPGVREWAARKTRYWAMAIGAALKFPGASIEKDSRGRRHLIFDPEQRDKLTQTMTEPASAKPVVRQRRRRPPDQQQQQTPPLEPQADTP